MRKRLLRLSVLVGISSMALIPAELFAQDENKRESEGIEDNSFLIEEAYNQDPGVIQHINSFQYMKDKTWVYTFTQEWPVPKEQHQLSFTIPFLSTLPFSGIGDVLINYRYQAVLTNRIGFSPRLSLVVPTGNYKIGAGAGVPGYQFSLPLSFLVSRKFVTHYNLGTTLTFNAKSPDGSKSDLITTNYGISLIWLTSKTFNLMLETVGNTYLTKKTTKNFGATYSLFVNPGFRYAINFKSGLQIVPGLAFPVGVGPSGGQYGLFAYLSFEGPVWKP